MSEFIPEGFEEGFEHKPEQDEGTSILSNEDLQLLVENAPISDVLDDQSARALGVKLMPIASYLARSRPPMTSTEINSHLANLKEQVGFNPQHGEYTHVPGFGNFSFTKKGKLIHYAEEIEKKRKQSGKSESATYGFAQFGEQECVMYAMNWDFIGGSVGVIAGEKLLAAARLAIKEHRPLVTVYSTGGMRQQENFFSVSQMPRTVAGLEEFNNKRDLAHIAVLLGHVWGGTSASTVPLADVIIAVDGSNFGFAGPNVIGAYEKRMPYYGSQTVEANYLQRYVDVITKNNELHNYIAKYLSISSRKRERLPDLHTKPNLGRVLNIGRDGFAPALESYTEHSAISVEFPNPKPFNPNSTTPEDLFDNYNRILSESGRPDGRFLVEHVFDEHINLYNSVTIGETVHFPPIACSLARIGDEQFLVIFNQPSYTVPGARRDSVQNDLYIRKHPATPGPHDFEHVHRQMQIAERRGLPIVTIVDTPGAEPTINAENNGQSFKIANVIRAIVKYPRPIYSFVTGGLGSGGGMAITALSPKFFVFDNGQLWVAEPASATAILQNTDKPTIDQVKEIIANFQCTPHELQQNGFPLEIIQTNENPLITAGNMREALLLEHEVQSKHSPEKIRKLRARGLYEIGRQAISYTKTVESRGNPYTKTSS